MLIKGVIHITGEPDSGKTTAALECGAHPRDIWFLDNDVKGRATVLQLLDAGVQFGRYDDLVALRAGKREVEYHEEILRLLDSAKSGTYQAIIWDTWSEFAKTCHDYVAAYPQKFRANWSPKGDIKGAQQWQEARRYEAELLHRLAELAETVVVVTHLKDHNLSGVKTGKQIPDASPALVRVPSLRLWLRRNVSSPVPIALVLKRVDRKEVTSSGIRTISVLPPKIVPLATERSIWDAINRYWHNPVGLRELLPDELPDDWELSIIRGTLTADQQRVFELMLKAGVVEVEPVVDDGTDLAAEAQRLRAEGKTMAEIAGELQVSVPDVVDMLKSGR